MAGSGRDISMDLRKAAGIDLITSEIALDIAKLLFEKHYSKDTTSTQLSLDVADLGDRWEVVGTKQHPQMQTKVQGLIGGRLVVHVMKDDGRVVQLVQEAYTTE